MAASHFVSPWHCVPFLLPWVLLSWRWDNFQTQSGLGTDDSDRWTDRQLDRPGVRAPQRSLSLLWDPLQADLVCQPGVTWFRQQNPIPLRTLAGGGCPMGSGGQGTPAMFL